MCGLNHEGGAWRLPLATLWFSRGGVFVAPSALRTAYAVYLKLVFVFFYLHARWSDPPFRAFATLQLPFTIIL